LKMAVITRVARTVLRWSETKRRAAQASERINRNAHHSELLGLQADIDGLANRARRDGVAVLPGYWPPQKCAEARGEIDRLARAYPESIQRYSGNADQRMFGVESTSSLLREFHADPFARKFGEILCGYELYNFATLAGHIRAISENCGSGEGWHRDAHGFQFKAILYLSDTSPENGPFEYILGSHKSLMVGLDTALGNLPAYPDTRYTDEQVNRLFRQGKRRQSFPAPAGTLLLVFTSGIHRGQPLLSGERYALTNYYYDRAGIDGARIEKFSPLMPGTAERIRRDMQIN
jgi:hypothetical protein